MVVLGFVGGEVGEQTVDVIGKIKFLGKIVGLGKVPIVAVVAVVLAAAVGAVAVAVSYVGSTRVCG